MSVEDGLTMQLHPGSVRNHNVVIYKKFGRDKGADMPSPTEYVRALRPLLDKYGNAPGFTFILFTLDETTFSRELAPLAGHYPCLRLGPPWWFHDSPEGMMRFRETATEIHGPSCRFLRGMMWPGGLIARSWDGWWRNTDWTRMRRLRWCRI
jgi:glucuronate isomerase